MGIFFLTESKERRGTGNTNKYLNLLSTQVSSPQRHGGIEIAQRKNFFFCESKKRDFSRETRQERNFFGYLAQKEVFYLPRFAAEISFFCSRKKKKFFPLCNLSPSPCLRGEKIASR